MSIQTEGLRKSFLNLHIILFYIVNILYYLHMIKEHTPTDLYVYFYINPLKFLCHSFHGPTVCTLGSDNSNVSYVQAI